VRNPSSRLVFLVDKRIPYLSRLTLYLLVNILEMLLSRWRSFKPPGVPWLFSFLVFLPTG